MGSLSSSLDPTAHVAPPLPQGPDAEKEVRALSELRWGALLYIAGQLLSWVGLVALFSSGSLSSPTQVSGISSELNLLETIGALGACISIPCYLLLSMGFRRLESFDPRFGTPGLLLLAGIPAALIGLLSSIYALTIFDTLSQCLATTPASSAGSCVNLGAIAGLFGLIALALVFSLIAVIGLVLGPYRIRDRYGEELARTSGTVFIVGVIIPFVGCIAAILFLVALGRIHPRGHAPPLLGEGRELNLLPVVAYPAPPPPLDAQRRVDALRSKVEGLSSLSPADRPEATRKVMEEAATLKRELPSSYGPTVDQITAPLVPPPPPKDP